MFYVESRRSEDYKAADYNKQTDSIQLKDKLVGELIGLARAVEGNEHLLQKSTAEVVVKGLFATETNADFDDAALLAMLDQVDMEKRKLVPDCYHCASSCGRTNPYDMRELWNAREEIRSLKYLILVAIRGIAVNVYHTALHGQGDDSIVNFLYKALYSLGTEDWSREDLLSVLQESGQVTLKSIALQESIWPESSE